MNRNRLVTCSKCGKSMRSDTLLRHNKVHTSIPYEQCDEKECEIVSKPRKLDETIEQLEQDLLQGNKIYLNKIELGRKISIIIEKGVVQEESLTKEQKEALELFRKRKPRFDVTTSILRPWQEQALELLETPTDRSIIWICGPNGNEGKSWFQSYIQSHYGFNRVVRLALRTKHGNLCNVLKKQSLSSLDIFLFNDARSVTGEDYNLYRILENIKDGHATASKYDNDNIHFKTPNTVVIFSNQLPNKKKLSKDRWIIFEIKDNELKNITTAAKRERQMGREEKKILHDSFIEENNKKLDEYMTRESDDSDCW